jgi:hypothetical protein
VTSVRAIVEEIDLTEKELAALNLTPVEMRSMLYFLAGADPTSMKYAVRFIENGRVQSAWYTAWKSCPDSTRYHTPNLHHADCVTCRKDSPDGTSPR